MATLSAIKNKSQSRSAMKNALDYISQKDKTLWQGHQLVTGHNCMAQCAMDEMMTTKQRFKKTGDRMFYHFVQSFSPEEDVTPEEVHAIGLELAEKLFPDFEVLVATHVDAHHLHNHLIVNSVSFRDGRKLHQNAADLQHQRQVSDELCAAHGLTVLTPAQKYAEKKQLGTREYRSAAKGESWKFQLMNTIDLCMRKAKMKEAFIREMERRGYQVRWEENRKAITYTTPTGRKCRDDRLHDKKYLKEVMECEFRIREQIVLRGIEAEKSARRGGVHSNSHAGTVGGADGLSGRPVSGGGPAARSAAEAGRHDDSDAPQLADGVDTDGKADKGVGDDLSAAPTGWERERAEAFASAPVPSPGALSGLAVGHSNRSGVVGDVVRLGHALEHDQQSEPAPVSPMTHGDRKALSKEREKKIAQGHRPNDREEQSHIGPSMG